MNTIEFPEFTGFDIKDQSFVNLFVARFNPLFCEYNFTNLFCWQKPARLSWCLYRGRLLIYDGIDECSFMPLGDAFSPRELVKLSKKMEDIGLKPDFALATEDYINEFPEISDYYIVEQKRDYAEYIYNVDDLCSLKGKKLAKKKNLISQFKRSFPDFKIELFADFFKQGVSDLAEKMSGPAGIGQEFSALATALDYFKDLKLKGLVLLNKNRVAGFSIFSPVSSEGATMTYDIHFEKADRDFKGASQMINHGTAEYLKDKCKYLNREQDLGLKGLRQSKMSYNPAALAIPLSLTLISRG